MDNNDKVIIEKDGVDVECETLFMFNSPDTGKSYIGFTDHSMNDNNEENVYVKSFNPLFGLTELEDIKDELEWNLVDEVLTKIKNS